MKQTEFAAKTYQYAAWLIYLQPSTYRHVETALLHLVFDIAAVLAAHVVEHLAQDEFQRVVAHLAAVGAVRVFHRLIAVIADVYRRAIQVARVFCGVAIVASQFSHILLCAQYAGHDEAVQGHAFYLEAVEESLSDVL